jgi:hypothetical protein
MQPQGINTAPTHMQAPPMMAPPPMEPSMSQPPMQQGPPQGGLMQRYNQMPQMSRQFGR